MSLFPMKVPTLTCQVTRIPMTHDISVLVFSTCCQQAGLHIINLQCNTNNLISLPSYHLISNACLATEVKVLLMVLIRYN